jgi:hypothetical protein
MSQILKKHVRLALVQLASGEFRFWRLCVSQETANS